MKDKFTAKELRQLYFDFFLRRGHKIIPSAPVIPEGDSSTLFTSAGMHPLVPYLLGEPHPLGKRLVGIQECLRTVDIDQVGDQSHHTWFEMLGNWSLGDYFKEEAIEWSFKFLTKVLKIEPNRLAVTCFAGDKDAPRDDRSAAVWRRLGISPQKIFFKPKNDNWWGPVGETGPCGPDTEMFVDTGGKPCSPSCEPGCSCGKYVEIWNNVFMEYQKDKKGNYLPLKQKNVDTGMGVERVVRIVNGLEDDYQTSIWRKIIKKIEKLSGKSYQQEKFQRPMRIIADHLRAAVFVVADGIVPGNKEQGYILRRLIRRSVREGRWLEIKSPFTSSVAESVLENQKNYGGDYPELDQNKEMILKVLKEEELRFEKTLDQGLKKLNRLLTDFAQRRKKVFPGEKAFYLYETFGFPFELIKEEVERGGLKIDQKGFVKKQKEHRQQSRLASAGHFKGGLGDLSSQAVAHHTATHLLHQALRQILGPHVAQAGSAITRDKLRFDFVHPAPLSPEELKKVETLVNKKIEENLPIRKEIMSLSQAQRKGALSFFKDRYPPRVSVYSIGNFSREICRGPHVSSTGELGRFKIIKEESCGSGKRRIYASLEREEKHG